MILKTFPSISMWEPFLNWLVEITGASVAGRVWIGLVAARIGDLCP